MINGTIHDIHNSTFDKEELQLQASELSALMDSLRPDPSARLISREKLALMAAIAGDADLIRLATHADENTLFWQMNGEIVKQAVSLREFRVS